MIHFIDARNALMRRHHWSRQIATLAVRIARGIDNYEIITACIGFTGKPLLTREAYNLIQEFLSDE